MSPFELPAQRPGRFQRPCAASGKDRVTVRREQQAVITIRSTIIGFCQFQKTTTAILSRRLCQNRQTFGNFTVNMNHYTVFTTDEILHHPPGAGRIKLQ